MSIATHISSNCTPIKLKKLITNDVMDELYRRTIFSYKKIIIPIIKRSPGINSQAGIPENQNTTGMNSGRSPTVTNHLFAMYPFIFELAPLPN